MDIAEIGFYFLLEIWGSVFRHTDFSRFKISEKKILKNSDFGCYRKMYRLDPCIPILRGGGGFFIKNAKRICICQYVIFSIDTFKNLCFDVKKEYKPVFALGSPKTYCLL